MFTESAEKLQTELREMRVQHYTLKEQHDDLKEKMKFFTKVISGLLFTECTAYYNTGNHAGPPFNVTVFFYVCHCIFTISFKKKRRHHLL